MKQGTARVLLAANLGVFVVDDCVDSEVECAAHAPCLMAMPSDIYAFTH